MEISVIDKQRRFFSFLHFVVIDSTDNLICASIGGIESSVTAVTAAIIEHRQCQVELRKDSVYLLKSDGEYRRLIKMSGGVAHGGFQSSCIWKKITQTYYICEDGNIEALAIFFQKFALLKDWIENIIVSFS